MTNQEMFDKVVNHMRAQGNPWGSVDERGWGYVNPLNPCQRCARGILYDVEFQDGQYYITKNDYIRLHRELFSNSGTQYSLILTNLENIFEYADPVKWEGRFQELAKENNLIYTEPMKKEIANGIESMKEEVK